ncbi:MAG: hypothetical protein IJG82_11120 [Atopobiaceae bacterium]|nr:hypothetical protein [Atopobiaceae bacterium]
MGFCVCGPSAKKVLDLIALKRIGHGGRADARFFEGCRAGKRELDAALSTLPYLERPVHLLVPEQELRVNDGVRRSHVWNRTVPEGALFRIAPMVCTVSPEFNALLEMRGASRISRALTLMDYCGIFAIDEGSEDGFVRRPQLTSTVRLRDFALETRFNPCSRLLADAVELALERARSPLEAKLALALTAPREMGGFGLPKPELNSPVDVGDKGFALIGRRSLEADLVWKSGGVIVEANGRLRHEDRFGEDLTRASAFEANGYSVRFVTSLQLRSPRQMCLLAQWLMDRLGIEMPFPDMAVLQRLLEEIMGFEYHHISLSAPHNSID